MHNAQTKVAGHETGEGIAMLAAPTPLVLLKLPTVKTRVGLNKTAIYAGIKAGWFPKPVKIGASSRWIESEIDALIVKLTEQRDQGVARKDDRRFRNGDVGLSPVQHEDVNELLRHNQQVPVLTMTGGRDGY